MSSTRLLTQSLFKYPTLLFFTVLLGFSGALFNGVSTLLILPILLELLGQAEEYTGSLPPILQTFVSVFDGLPENIRLPVMAGSVVGVIVLKSLSTYASALTAGTLNRKLAMSLRRQGLRMLLDVDLGYFAQTKIGDLINQLNVEVNRTTIAIRNLVRIVVLVITLAVFLILLLLTSWQLTVISTVTLGSVTLLNQFIVKRSKVLGKRLSETSKAYSSRVFEVLSGIRLVKATANEEREYNYLDNIIIDRESAEFNSQLVFAGIAPFNEIINILALMLIAVLGRMAFSNQLELFESSLVAYLIILFRTLPFIGQLNSQRSTLANTSTSVEVVTALLKRDDKPFMPRGAKPYRPLQKGIHFNQIRFNYPGHEQEILRGIDLFLPKGQTLALVGSSGAGKSTLADLLPRFYDPTSGTIELDGVDLKTIDLCGYRSNLGIVSQETFLFNASVRENLLYGRPEATDTELKAAAKQANAYEFIENLPQGFETMIGDRGVLLSGGQRQRLAIARALLQDPDILILDEATSALDTVSERLVQNAIDELSRDRTTLVIAHRLSTIHEADQIAVLERGKVMEVGTHGDLLAKRGAYAKLHAMQRTKGGRENGAGNLVSSIVPVYRKAIGKSSYELRSQLNSMIGLLALIQDDVDDPYEQAELMSYAQTIAIDLLSVVENLEAISTPMKSSPPSPTTTSTPSNQLS
ncbi:ATP-binding cassette domain-containing protein [Leptolyngbya cf. ectocarpi LEGE 11479]|uniref:ATP-binding cassette domain-containing protein n=1 Tax=Leptolyngbya cf. ectocarpi LEGE 11479 TaxID=1828722 RepID=A0A928ZW03_LEPEC|nr:ABC transporter ATP-binding protein [Leptolyngbya ectocarpi]MBE9068487.1 ATP-binding cassette domain-containing protein [Leptolyngbya cf. ectocarpi LEGE 11479]